MFKKYLTAILLLVLTLSLCGLLAACGDKGTGQVSFTVAELTPILANTIYEYTEAEERLDGWSYFWETTDGPYYQRRVADSIGPRWVELYLLTDEDFALVYGNEVPYTLYHQYFANEPPNMGSMILRGTIELGAEWLFAAWESGDYDTAEVTAVGLNVKTPFATFRDAVEITINYYTGETAKQYYAKDYGLVRTVFYNEDGEVASEFVLANIIENTVFKTEAPFFFPDENGELDFEVVTIEYTTHANFNEIFLNTAREFYSNKFGIEINGDLQINSVRFNRDPDELTVNIDFSAELTDELKKAGERVDEFLTAVKFTVSNFYRAFHDVVITVDGEAFALDAA